MQPPATSWIKFSVFERLARTKQPMNSNKSDGTNSHGTAVACLHNGGGEAAQHGVNLPQLQLRQGPPQHVPHHQPRPLRVHHQVHAVLHDTQWVTRARASNQIKDRLTVPVHLLPTTSCLKC